jgi:hypothetical protein
MNTTKGTQDSRGMLVQCVIDAVHGEKARDVRYAWLIGSTALLVALWVGWSVPGVVMIGVLAALFLLWGHDEPRRTYERPGTTNAEIAARVGWLMDIVGLTRTTALFNDEEQARESWGYLRDWGMVQRLAELDDWMLAAVVGTSVELGTFSLSKVILDTWSEQNLSSELRRQYTKAAFGTMLFRGEMDEVSYRVVLDQIMLEPTNFSS